jgi:glycosyltransferase involved in cell wall biosynthesis
LQEVAKCVSEKIVVIPNATRAKNVFRELPSGPSPLPHDVSDLPRPIAGVIGNLASNMDWNLLEQVVNATPAFTWVFVGPVEMPVDDREQRLTRARLLKRGGRIRFVGSKPYSRLCDYARAFDVAVLPYRMQEPTYSGSATRFYEHLAACRPMVSTRAVAELLDKEPLLQLVANSEEMISRLEALRAASFQDGNELVRWKASFAETWHARAASVKRALDGTTANIPFCQASTDV